MSRVRGLEGRHCWLMNYPSNSSSWYCVRLPEARRESNLRGEYSEKPPVGTWFLEDDA